MRISGIEPSSVILSQTCSMLKDAKTRNLTKLFKFFVHERRYLREEI